MTPSERDAVARTVRALCGGFEAEAVALLADLLNTIEAARDVLAPVADHASEAGIAAGIAFQMLADAAAGAVPLKSEAK